VPNGFPRRPEPSLFAQRGSIRTNAETAPEGRIQLSGCLPRRRCRRGHSSTLQKNLGLGFVRWEEHSAAVDPNVTTIVVAGLGVFGTAAGSVISYRAATATAASETGRTRLQHREDERRNRQNTYHRMLSFFGALDSWARDPTATVDQFEALATEFNFVQAGVLLFGDETVADGLSPITEGLELIGAGDGRSRNRVTRWKAAYHRHSAVFIDAQGALVAAMRADLQRALPR
jgi:hypothetical protein